MAPNDYGTVMEFFASRENAAAAAADVTGAKLLIVDPNQNVARIIALVASQIGMEVQTECDPMRATEAFLTFRPDVVVLELFMPEKDGIDVLHEILPAGLPTHVIVTSAYSESYLKLAVAVAAFHEHEQISTMRKPFRRDHLIRLLRQATGRTAGLPSPRVIKQQPNDPGSIDPARIGMDPAIVHRPFSDFVQLVCPNTDVPQSCG
jgi:CheY-like chemotaxis protein